MHVHKSAASFLITNADSTDAPSKETPGKSFEGPLVTTTIAKPYAGDHHNLYHSGNQSHPSAIAPTLVMYVFSDTDKEYFNNLRFFIKHAIRPNDNCQYIIILQVGDASTTHKFPELPSNAHYLIHSNECYDLGTFGWAFHSQIDNLSSYKYFILMNSSIRGPFFPAYMPKAMHWTDTFTSKINDNVKLVGPTINCGGIPGMPTTAPHVQSYLLATDRIGLDVLLKTVLSCYDNIMDTIKYGEIGASKAIMDAGYTIDCLMLKYQGVDWRNARVGRECNANVNPLVPRFVDGTTITPFEVLFVKVKDEMKTEPQVLQAIKFDEWMDAATAYFDHPSPSTKDKFQKMAISNGWKDHIDTCDELKLDDAKSRGIGCFDSMFYLGSNLSKDLEFMKSLADTHALAWNHFLEHGIFEGRPYKFYC